jgi:hypothetical protein
MFRSRPQDYFATTRILLDHHSSSMVHSFLLLPHFHSSLLMLDFVEGQFFKDATLSSITSPETRKEMYFHLLDSLAKIHAVDVDGECLKFTPSFFPHGSSTCSCGIGRLWEESRSIPRRETCGSRIHRSPDQGYIPCLSPSLLLPHAPAFLTRPGVVITNLQRQSQFLKWISSFTSYHSSCLLKLSLSPVLSMAIIAWIMSSSTLILPLALLQS